MTWGEWQDKPSGMHGNVTILCREDGAAIEFMTAARANAYVACAEALPVLLAKYEEVVKRYFAPHADAKGNPRDDAAWAAATDALAALEGAADA